MARISSWNWPQFLNRSFTWGYSSWRSQNEIPEGLELWSCYHKINSLICLYFRTASFPKFTCVGQTPQKNLRRRKKYTNRWLQSESTRCPVFAILKAKHLDSVLDGPPPPPRAPITCFNLAITSHSRADGRTTPWEFKILKFFYKEGKKRSVNEESQRSLL